MSDFWQNRIVESGAADPQELAKGMNPLNWRGHPEAQRDALEEALDSIGFLQRVLVNRASGRVIDGHLRIELAVLKGQPLIPVDYVELTDDEEALALATLDAITEQAEPIADKLAALLERTRHLTADKPGLAGMLAALKERAGVNGNGKEPGRDVEPQIDKAAQLAEKWGVKLGQVWELGQHRLVCGDCTDRATVEAVMRGERARLEFSDPPYDFETRGGGIREDAAHMDAIELAGISDFDPLILTLIAITSVFCCNKSLIPSYITLAKNNHQSWDLCFYKKENTPPNFGGHLMTDTEYLPIIGKQAPIPGMEKQIYSKAYIGKLDDNHLVAWAKPVGLVEKFARLYSLPSDIVIDRYSGTGTTLIACENLNRRCRAIEIDPGYCGVSIQRWVDLTGQQPRLVSG